MSTDNRPIGVLDSGLGGISVLRELVKLMPGEDFISVSYTPLTVPAKGVVEVSGVAAACGTTYEM